jgi:hypothetical protein
MKECEPVKIHNPQSKIRGNYQMKAISVTGKIDEQGQLSIEKPLENLKSTSVQVIIILEDNDSPSEPSLEPKLFRQEQELLPLEEFQQEFKQALIEAGYDSREKIIKLVQEVKQEMVEEHKMK